jgi:hypothetical protein
MINKHDRYSHFIIVIARLLEDGFDYAFDPEHIRRASDRANGWADFIALRKRIIGRFNPKDATVRLGVDLNIAEGDKVRFYCDCINEKLVEKVSDYNDEMRVTIMFVDHILPWIFVKTPHISFHKEQEKHYIKI